MKNRYTILLALGLGAWTPMEQGTGAYRAAIQRTAAMVRDGAVQAMARRQGLSLVNVTWEDTGRYKNSAVGPNISDMTIQVGLKRKDKGYDLTLMPVFRYDNFSDRTADVDPRLFTLLVGNERDGDLKRISLREFLEDPTRYLSNPRSWKGGKKSLLAPRDSKVLVSAQACFLPVPKKEKALFNPVLFNYQSRGDDPAVLTILATRQGTSVTIIDNKRDGLPESPGWGQRLFHNQDGKRASLTGERLSDFRLSDEGKKNEDVKNLKNDKESSGLNMVLLIQVPLKQKRPMRFEAEGIGSGAALYESAPMAKKAARASDVEAAVIGHGDFEGPFTEVADLAIERDPDFPIRVTVQFYKATATGRANDDDIRQIKEEIDGVLENGDAVGSLVVAGETGRVTEYAGVKVQPPGWWDAFWKRHQENTGETREQAIARLRKLIGDDYAREPMSELRAAELLRHRKGS